MRGIFPRMLPIPDRGTRGGRLPLSRTPAAGLVRSALQETEHRIAVLRIVVGALVAVIGPLLVYLGGLPLRVPSTVFALVECSLLVYALFYLGFAPYRKDDVLPWARAMSFLDLLFVGFNILNTGGLDSPLWVVAPAIVLMHVIRFGLTRQELVGTILVYVVVMAFLQRFDPHPPAVLIMHFVGIGLGIALVLFAGVVMMEREREAVEEAFTNEARAISRIVNTVQHEVNNPLAVAAGNMELLKLRRQIASGDGLYLERIEQSLARVSDAVARLRELQEDPDIVGEGLIQRYEARGRGGPGKPPDGSASG